MPEFSSLHPGDPRRLGRYRLKGRLGEGGQGVVYAATGPDGSRVAVKVLHTGWAADGMARRSFEKEVAAARRVAPFCVAQVLDANLSKSPPFIVTEFVDGPTLLRSVRDEGPRSGPALHRLAVATATALAAIHEAGVVHRDFKPANVLLGADGPRVIDFGIARTLDGGPTLTGGIVGTPSYMAPEQFEERTIGPAADVFAWGCVLVFAASGSPPFAGESIAAIGNRVLRGKPDLGPLSGPLRDIVLACLAKDERARPSMRDVLIWLLGRPDARQAPIGEALVAGRRTSVLPDDQLPDTSAPPPGTVPGGRMGRRGPVVAAAAVAAAAVITTAGLVVWPGLRGNGAVHRPTPPPSASASASADFRDTGQLSRTPRLGLEFWQGGAPDAMSFAHRGDKDVVTVKMKKAPFELRFPKQAEDVAVEVCAWTDDSVFNLRNGASVAENPCFRPGTGLADYEYGSGTLFLNNESHNEFVGTRITHQSADQDKVYLAQTWRDRRRTPLRQRRGDVYLTIFIDKNKDGTAQLTSPAEYEFVVLHF
ncbi:serine/threonine protein kinase [Actinoallomurus sp. NBC_01490]|uniref:serine/threonine-protein kinase n=1 Tax=Actinoallomurus sp. NBC_01490 TaxID=2903557 RepID=UPI002E3433B3|nr:serine/threonine-protein kinase [Actinoallomurus sp. NBC_01490]